jgi:hypothetical protein
VRLFFVSLTRLLLHELFLAVLAALLLVLSEQLPLAFVFVFLLVWVPIGPRSDWLLTSTEELIEQALQAIRTVGAPGLEPGTSSPPDWRANQAAPRPVGRRV